VGDKIDDRAIDLLFRQARTQNGWFPTPVADEQLRARSTKY
jgi:3-hydroxypropanoate dehydrogenase